MKSIKAQMDELEAVLPSVVGPTFSSVLRSRGHPPNILDSYKHSPHDVRDGLYFGKVTIDEVRAAIAADEKQTPQGRKASVSMSETKAAGPTRSEGFAGIVSVKSPLDKLSTIKCRAHHPQTGAELFHPNGLPVYMPSQGENAIVGSYFKSVAQRAGLQVAWQEWERDYFEAAQLAAPWAGDIAGEYHGEIEVARVKALLDDTTSGGIEIAPVVLDQNIITFPLLSGQLFRAVDVVDIPPGRRVEGASVNTPTVTWGTAEGTAITPFTTDSLVAGLDTTIHPVTVGVEIGRDMMADSIINIGETLTRLVGERLAAELDYVLAVGNVTYQPTGLFTASGVTDIGAPSGGAGADWTSTDAENLYFGVPNEYLTGGGIGFVANDTTYKRIRQIAYATSAGWTFNVRALTDSVIVSYNIYGVPWRVQNDIPNARAMFGDLKRCRLYRRVCLSS